MVPEITSPSGNIRLNVPVIVLVTVSALTLTTFPDVKNTPEPTPLKVPVP